MSKQLRVNIRVKVNTNEIKESVDANGRAIWVLPSSTLPNDVVMNGIKYPASEIAKSFNSLEGTPAPMGHPMVRGEYVSASHSEAYPFLTGAINRNVEYKDGRVFLEKHVDIEYAKRNHPQLVEAINKKKPIHTSTGLLLKATPAVNTDEYDYIASDMQFDHDCFLLGESGAATPEQGVGVFVNASGDTIEVVNSVLNSEKHDLLSGLLQGDVWLSDFTDSTLYYSEGDEHYEHGYTLADGVAALTGERYNVKRTTVWERISNALKFNNPTKTNKVTKMDEELKAALAGITQAVNSLTEKQDALAGEVTAIKASAEQVETDRMAAQNAALADKRAIVANKLGEAVAGSLSGAALDEAVAKLQSADALAGGLNANSQQAEEYKFPEGV